MVGFFHAETNRITAHQVPVQPYSYLLPARFIIENSNELQFLHTRTENHHSPLSTYFLRFTDALLKSLLRLGLRDRKKSVVVSTYGIQHPLPFRRLQTQSPRNPLRLRGLEWSRRSDLN